MLNFLEKSIQFVFLLVSELRHQVLDFSCLGMIPFLKFSFLKILNLLLHFMSFNIFFLLGKGFLDLSEVDNFS